MKINSTKLLFKSAWGGELFSISDFPLHMEISNGEYQRMCAHNNYVMCTDL